MSGPMLLTAKEIADLAGKTNRAIRKRANKDEWEYITWPLQKPWAIFDSVVTEKMLHQTDRCTEKRPLPKQSAIDKRSL